MSACKYIYVIRHGERYDSIHPEWKATAKRPHDPHLSPAGVKQAYTTGQFIAHRTRKERGENAMADIAIFTSPFLRCVQTAKAVSHGYYDQLSGKPVSNRAASPSLSNLSLTPQHSAHSRQLLVACVYMRCSVWISTFRSSSRTG